MKSHQSPKYQTVNNLKLINVYSEFLGISSNDANSPYQKEIIEKLSSPVFETHLPRPKLSNTPSAVEQPVSFSLEKEITEIESLLIDVKSPTSNSLIQKASLSESEKSKQTLLNDKTKIVIQNKNENDPKNEMSVESQISILSGLLAEMSVKKARLSSANQTPNMTPVQSKFSIEIPTKKISSPPSPENNSRQNHIDSLISKRDISKSLKNSDIDVTSLSAGNHSQSSKVISKTNMIKYQLLTSEIRSMHSDFPKNLDLGSDMSVSELQDLSIWLLKRQITSDQKIEELKKEISLLKHKNAQ